MDDVLRQRKREATAHRQALRLAHSDITEQAALFSQLTVPEVLGNRKLLQELTGKSTEWWALPLEPNPVLMPTVTAVSAVGETQDTVEGTSRGMGTTTCWLPCGSAQTFCKVAEIQPLPVWMVFLCEGRALCKNGLGQIQCCCEVFGERCVAVWQHHDSMDRLLSGRSVPERILEDDGGLC